MTAHPATMLRAASTLAGSLAARWTMYEEVEAWLARPLVAAAGGGGRSTDVPDPTHDIATSHERYFELAAEVTETLGHLRALQRRMDKVLANHPHIASVIESETKAARCSGEVDPMCVNNAVRFTGDSAGLCWKCIKRKQRDSGDEAVGQ